jgi:predicted small lipoprotein YifL
MKRILSLIAVVTAASTLLACGKKASAAEATNTESAPKVDQTH